MRVVLPTSKDEIPAALKALRAQLDVLRTQERLLQGAVDAVQAMCDHPKEHRKNYSVMGEPTSECGYCGKGLY